LSFSDDSAASHFTRYIVLFLVRQATPLSFAEIAGHQTISVLSTSGFHGVMQQRVHQSWVHNIDEVRQRLLNLYHGMDHSAVDNVVDEWCKHLHFCVRANGLIFSSY